MPATKLSRKLFNPDRQKQTFDGVVAELMARKQIKTQAQLAPQLHMSESMLSRRMKSGDWKAAELWRLIYVLEPTPDDLMRMMVNPAKTS